MEFWRMGFWNMEFWNNGILKLNPDLSLENSEKSIYHHLDFYCGLFKDGNTFYTYTFYCHTSTSLSVTPNVSLSEVED
jgi:hypothetical protein